MPELLQPYYQYVIERPALFAIALVVLFAAVFLLRRSQKAWLSHIQQKPLLTANETEFLYRLRRALPGHHVFPQVSFAAFITDDGKLSANAPLAGLCGQSLTGRLPTSLSATAIWPSSRWSSWTTARMSPQLIGSAMRSHVQQTIRRSAFNRSKSPRRPRSPLCFNMREHGPLPKAPAVLLSAIIGIETPLRRSHSLWAGDDHAFICQPLYCT